MQQNLGWNAQLVTGVKALLPDLSKILGILKHMSREIPGKSRLKLANGLIQSRLNYVIALWSGTYPKNLRKVQVTMWIDG